MVRKQLYIGEEQQRKLRRLAAQWGCTEAEVMRSALDRLPDPEGTIVERLRAAGIIEPPPDDPDLPTQSEVEELERWLDDWTAHRTEPLGLSAAVLEDRR